MMSNISQGEKVTIFDTTLRDGELALKHKLTAKQKVNLAIILDKMGVDVIEIGYPGVYSKDADEILLVSQKVKNVTICGLSSSKQEEIVAVAKALRQAMKGRINIFTPVRLTANTMASQVIDLIRDSVSLARNYCSDVQWSAFDATRSDSDFLCKAVETAINSGARTISIPDSLGVASPTQFFQLVKTIIERVPNVDSASISIHCHNDNGFAVDNSVIAVEAGAKQIECSINGLGVRAGNADLAKIVQAIASSTNYYTEVDQSWLRQASELVNQFMVVEK
jgi:2-isopropylmalate synthase